MRTLFRKLVKTLGWSLVGLSALGLSFYLLLLAINWNDDPLNPEAERLASIEVPPLSAQPNAYFGLIGLLAPDDRNPDTWGRTWVEQARVIDNELERAGGQRIPGSDRPPIAAGMRKAVVDDQTLLCEHAAACLKQVADRPDATRRALEAEAVLLARFDALLALPYEEPLRHLRLDSPLPPYPVRIRKLLAMRFALLVESGQYEAAMMQWQRERDFAVRRLVGSTTLIGKMMAVNSLQRLHALLATHISRHPDAVRVQAATWQAMLQPMPAEALSLQPALDSEIRQVTRLNSSILVEAGLSSSSDIVFSLAKPLFLPAATTNLIVGNTLAWRQADDLKGADYRNAIASARQRLKQISESGEFRLRNPLGWALNFNLLEDYGSYFARRDDLVANEEVLRLALGLLEKPQPVGDQEVLAAIAAAGEHLLHPYNGSAVQWDAGKRTLAYAQEAVEERHRLPAIQLP